jgi:cell division protein FtsN
VSAPIGETKSAPFPAAARTNVASALRVYKTETAAPMSALAPEPSRTGPIARPPAPPAVVGTPLRAAPVSAVAEPTPVHAASAAKPATRPKPGPAVVAKTPASIVAASGGALVQIGAFPSAALAEKGWSDAVHVLPSQLAGKSHKIEVATRDGTTFYRTLVGGFANRADAVSFCSALKAAGKPCFAR